MKPHGEQDQTLSGPEKEAIKTEVKEQFYRLVDSLNQLNAGAWAEFYSNNEFLSAIAGSDYYGDRHAWVDIITSYFSVRVSQHVEPVEVRVTALSQDLALMTSDEHSEMGFNNGQELKFRHLFTMIWKKEEVGWKILHSHESWSES